MNDRIPIELNDRLLRYLDILVASGLYGADRQEACERIVAQHIESITIGEVASPASEAINEAMKSYLGTESSDS